MTTCKFYLLTGDCGRGRLGAAELPRVGSTGGGGDSDDPEGSGSALRVGAAGSGTRAEAAAAAASGCCGCCCLGSELLVLEESLKPKD